MPTLLAYIINNVGKIWNFVGTPLTLTRPIFRIHSLRHITRKARIFPSMRASNQTMLNQIVMDIIQIVIDFLPIAQTALPKPTLPHIPLSVLPTRSREILGHFSIATQSASKQNFHPTHTSRIVTVLFWQLPQKMEMIRQNNRSYNVERSLFFGLSKGIASWILCGL